MRRPLAVLGVLVVLLAGCRSAGRAEPAPEPVRPAWQPVTLPVPPGPPGRLALRDATACGGRWFVVGAVIDLTGGTRPAAWRSADAVTWTPLRPVPRSAYGEENLLTAAGCRDGRLAAVGGKTGGVHGNPRISTWREVADGSLVEVPAEFEVFGGPDAVNVGRIAGGPRGWLISGNRATGAAAWVSPDGADFQLVSAVPGLAADEAGRPWAADGIATPSGWLLVGSLLPRARTGSDPVVWTSADGRSWRRAVLPGGDGAGDLQRVVGVGERTVAVGRRGDRLGAWVDEGGRWRAGGAFGAASGAVSGLAAVSGGVLVLPAAGATGWVSRDGDSWSPVALPMAVPAGSERAVAVAGSGDVALIAVDDGARVRIWSGHGPWRPR
ncbi:hypothetical protein Q2K19_20615 [Micromonospora soli]|uniref:hypothetical protein n=1 Tax=Micromonospora sp. NBRC 110009 TaxID=3061627 RepID=UPI0026727914|nr:hypothetical protein [Micromonospora sp. NBRC 110009]WKT96604.1 hypothetical protein Q2K19_20615 [Micromonospora sp. NBRC 110009]